MLYVWAIAFINMKYILLEKMATINFIFPEFPTAWRLSFKESRRLPAKCNENLQKWKRIMGSACKYPYIVVVWLYSVDMSTHCSFTFHFLLHWCTCPGFPSNLRRKRRKMQGNHITDFLWFLCIFISPTIHLLTNSNVYSVTFTFHFKGVRFILVIWQLFKA